jgi:hypothetical protein
MAALPPAIFFINGDAISYPTDTNFIGADLTQVGSSVGPDTLTELYNQLFINDVISKAEFDYRVQVEPAYPRIIHLQGLRVLVVCPDYYDVCNKHLADVIMYFHQGMIDVEYNRLAWPIWGSPCTPRCCGDGYGHHHEPDRPGPPGRSWDAQRINMYELIRAGRKERDGGCCEVEIPWNTFRCDQCDYPFFCDRCHTFSGMKVCAHCRGPCGCGCGTVLIDQQGVRSNVIHAPNCDNEYHNKDFIYRK